MRIPRVIRNSSVSRTSERRNSRTKIPLPEDKGGHIGAPGLEEAMEKVNPSYIFIQWKKRSQSFYAGVVKAKGSERSGAGLKTQIKRRIAARAHPGFKNKKSESLRKRGRTKSVRGRNTWVGGHGKGGGQTAPFQ